MKLEAKKAVYLYRAYMVEEAEKEEKNWITNFSRATVVSKMIWRSFLFYVHADAEEICH